MTRMGHNEMLAEVKQSGCQHLTSALIAKGPTCVAKRRNGKSPTGQFIGSDDAERPRADIRRRSSVASASAEPQLCQAARGKAPSEA